MPKKRRGGEDDNKPTISDLFGAFEYFIDYDKDGYYVLAHKAKGKKEKVVAMSQSPSQLLSHAYLELGMKNIIYVSDVVSYIVDLEQDDAITKIADELSKSLDNFINKFLNKNNTGFIEEDGA